MPISFGFIVATIPSTPQMRLVSINEICPKQKGRRMQKENLIQQKTKPKLPNVDISLFSFFLNAVKTGKNNSPGRSCQYFIMFFCLEQKSTAGEAE